jgi:hypothetical protein
MVVLLLKMENLSLKKLYIELIKKVKKYLPQIDLEYLKMLPKLINGLIL